MTDGTTKDAGAVEGERRKLAAHAVLEARRGRLILLARRALLSRLLAGQPTVNADDAREAVDLPTKIDPRFLGTVPGQLARAGLIQPVGYAKSRRPEAHGRPVCLWELVDPDKARAWLRENPGPADATDPAGPTLPLPADPTPEPAAAGLQEQARLFD